MPVQRAQVPAPLPRGQMPALDPACTDCRRLHGHTSAGMQHAFLATLGEVQKVGKPAAAYLERDLSSKPTAALAAVDCSAAG